MSPYRLTTLPNGVRIASVEMPHMRSVSVGVWAGVGGRHEGQNLSGMSHFVEHLLFKGTRKRNAKQITEAVEGIGGYLNAFTTEDHTCYYAKAASKHFGTLCDVLGDMYLNSQFSPVEIERERDVIREEILMVHDSPAQHVQELLSDVLWPDHPLGRPLTGTAESIARFKRDDFTDFTSKYYNGRTTVLAVAGQVTHECVVEHFAPLFASLPTGRRPRFTKAAFIPTGGPKIATVKQDIEQTHMALGFHAIGRHDMRRYALKLLSVILGENMSSRLFQKLRERHGICYSISSGLVSLDDTGALTIFAALEPAKLEKAIKLTLQELDRFIEKPPTKSELQKAKDYTIGQTLMGLESTSSQMMWMGESILSYDKIVDPADVETRLNAVTREEISAVAKASLGRAGLALAITGEAPAKEKIRTWLK